MTRCYMGIDPGKNGAIAVLDDDGCVVHLSVMPKTKTNELDSRKIATTMLELSDKLAHAVLEDVHTLPGMSARSNFEMGRSFEAARSILEIINVAYTRVQPKAWQKIAWQGIKPVTIATGKRDKKGEVKHKVDTKATSLEAARRLFPSVDLRGSDRCRTPHDGIVDALLIADYCRRTFK